MARGDVKVAIISGAVSVIVALIVAGTTIYTTRSAAQTAAESAKTSAKDATSSASEAKASLVQTKKAISAIPGAVTTHYRGQKKQSNGTAERFNFTERVYDPQGAVVTGNDWRLVIPVDGTYYIGANFTLPYGEKGSSHISPFVSCSIHWLKTGTASSEPISSTHAFNPACALAGVYSVSKGDQIYIQLNKDGAFDGTINGEFFSVLVGPRQER